MTEQDEFPEAEQPLAQSAVQQAEPQTGGSFTRDIHTGELVANTPGPDDQPEQE